MIPNVKLTYEYFDEVHQFSDSKSNLCLFILYYLHVDT